MQGTHDLGRTPSLFDAQVGHNVGGLEAAVIIGWDTCNSGYEGATDNGTDAIGNSGLARRFNGD